MPLSQNFVYLEQILFAAAVGIIVSMVIFNGSRSGSIGTESGIAMKASSQLALFFAVQEAGSMNVTLTRSDVVE